MSFLDTIPNEVLLNILLALNRNEIEKCQLICHKWRDLINSSIESESLPYRRLHLLKLGERSNDHRGRLNAGSARVVEKEG